MGIVKPMIEVVAGVEVASALPGSISQEPARPAPSPSYHLINTPPPPYIYFQNLADYFRTALETRNQRFTKGRRNPVFRSKIDVQLIK